jgi:hypothetical protein
MAHRVALKAFLFVLVFTSTIPFVNAGGPPDCSPPCPPMNCAPQPCGPQPQCGSNSPGLGGLFQGGCFGICGNICGALIGIPGALMNGILAPSQRKSCQPPACGPQPCMPYNACAPACAPMCAPPQCPPPVCMPQAYCAPQPVIKCRPQACQTYGPYPQPISWAAMPQYR